MEDDGSGVCKKRARGSDEGAYRSDVVGDICADGGGINGVSPGRPRRNPKSTAGAVVTTGPRMEEDEEATLWADFDRVRKNRAACLQFLVGLTQAIERLWVAADDEEAQRRPGGEEAGGEKEERQQGEHEQGSDADASAGGFGDGARARVLARVLLLRRCLESLREHRDNDLRELSRLADKIKPDNVHRLSLKHFLG